MTGPHLRPRISVPWPYLVAFAALVYGVRSALRGWDLRPDPLDYLVFGGLAVIIALRIWLGRSVEEDDAARTDMDVTPPTDTEPRNR